MYKMNNRVVKKQIFDICTDKQIEKIRHLENEMADAQKSANDYGQQSDAFDSQRMQLIGKRDMYFRQLQVELEMLETLNKIDTTVRNDTVEFGSLVITDMQNVFISIGLGKIKYENTTFYAISLKVPFFEAMSGLKEGDTFEFRGRKITIKEIY